MLGFYVVFGAAVAVLLFLWHRRRDRHGTEAADYDPHGHGLTDEAATAIGDVTREIVGPDRR
jgi:hypothetical protein